MAISLKDQETLTDAIRIALAERLVRERLKRGKAPDVMAQVEEIVRQYKALPILDHRSADEILGYDENGLPS